MAHIHTELGQHDHTVTACIVRLDGSEPRVLLHMHKKLGRLLPIGGHIELNETPWQAMAHELLEESGYKLNSLKILQPKQRIESLHNAIIHPYPVVMNTHNITADHSHSDTTYAFVADGEPQVKIGDDESSDLRWLTRPELNQLNESDIFLDAKEVYNFILDVCIKDWDQIETSAFKL